MSFLRSLFPTAFACVALTSSGQPSILPDPDAIEGVIVERYYVADANDAADEDGSAQLVEGAVTYRVFIDMKDGYELLTLSGYIGHPLTFNTTTTFFNNEDRGETYGDAVGYPFIDQNTVAIDSWLAIGAACNARWGVLKSDDPDGSVVGGTNNDGGSNAVEGGLLVNDDPLAGIPLTTSDGLMTGGSVPPASTSLGDFPECFNTSGSSFTSENYGLAVLGGVPCPTPGNRILIGQFTTDGVFSFCLNISLRIPDSLICEDAGCQNFVEYFPSLNDQDTVGWAGLFRFALPALCWSSDDEVVDCLGEPGGPALPGTACDDGIAATTNDVYSGNCVCTGEDCEGVLGGNALPGQPCDDGDTGTENDIWQDNCTCVGVVGIDEVAGGPLVAATPNPVRDLLRLCMGRLGGEAVTVSVKNAMGEQVYRRDLGRAAGDRSETIDLSSLATGAYLLEVIAGDRRHVERIDKF